MAAEPKLLPLLLVLAAAAAAASDRPLCDGSLCRCKPESKQVVCRSAALDRVPSAAVVARVPAVKKLDLTGNNITYVATGDMEGLNTLEELNLRKNHLWEIEVGAFAGLENLKILDLDDNYLTEIPQAVVGLPLLKHLSLSNNKIKVIPHGVLQKLPRLLVLELRGNPMTFLHPDAFVGLTFMRKLILSDARNLTIFPNLNGSSSIEILTIERASLQEVPSNLCALTPKLKSLDLSSNELSRIPDLSECKELRILELSKNQIETVESHPFSALSQLHDLLLSRNKIKHVPQEAFKGLSKLQVLDLEGNGIESIHPETFIPLTTLEDLNLGNNQFSHLPEQGLSNLLHLKTFNNPNLREFPGPQHFPRILTLVLSYAYHCCAFQPPDEEDADSLDQNKLVFDDTVIFPGSGSNFDLGLWNSSDSELWPKLRNLTDKFGPDIAKILESFGPDVTYPSNLPAYMEEYYEEHVGAKRHGRVHCLPLPGPFLPCHDLFDWWTLRCGVWIVFLLAMLGNGTVVFVLTFSRSKMDVPRFLVCNLAMADFFMGIYLGFLAVVDASTLGEFRKYAIPWQMSVGCQLAGFLGVLSCELSVYTLAVITLERNYAITHAMHLNKRLSLKHAGYIMLGGWTFSLSMAILPLIGISDYRKFAVCLPFETMGTASLSYVVFLMFINGVAFLILMGCYLKMYCAIRGSQAWNSNDSRIAKRMALLVFTDFICWSPIAFFSLTAAFGLQLISLEQAKVFTVFVLPLNSCCNPFLYAILTKQFKKDCVLICKAIEESRVTRGIGRCRHSSNFSNRQTPANTNSLVDRSSREHAPCACSAMNIASPTAKLLAQNPRMQRIEIASPNRNAPARMWIMDKVSWFLCHKDVPLERNDQYAYQIAEIQQKQHKRASSVSSENFSSSRSDSWRNAHHRCGIPLRLLDPKRRSSWAVTRKTSQESNLSSSRNDSATSASTSTWRMSRSSASGSESYVVPKNRAASASSAAAHPSPLQPLLPVASGGGAEPVVVPCKAKPRLTRQSAVSHPELGDEPAPRGLLVRHLATIPSAAESTEVGGAGADFASAASTSTNSQLEPSHKESVKDDSIV
ncbi:Hypothetical predicted protein [Cloeon dipterum]|uniref:G-protein coupled receptors family 1 profile domain-containing protein n=2 Tax=Cloeon dipterum TaxID=197152 RepID=A0A8S1CHF3_9INSE|nr:Hypothetical predicted protein [Cloeon dipterum]